MQVTVLGLGNIGGTIGEKWLQAGHQVAFGVHNIESPSVQTFRARFPDGFVTDSLSQAIHFGHVVLFAVPSTAVTAIVDAHLEELDGKIIIDATNNLNAADMSQIPLFTRKLPGASVFRAFSNLGWENFAQPEFGEIQADLLYCGPLDTPAQQVVEGLISDVGLRPIRLGDLDQRELIDATTRLWVALAYGQQMGRRLAFKVLTP
jgi:predicted dinucleotide-binding enzyme